MFSEEIEVTNENRNNYEAEHDSKERNTMSNGRFFIMEEEDLTERNEDELIFRQNPEHLSFMLPQGPRKSQEEGQNGDERAKRSPGRFFEELKSQQGRPCNHDNHEEFENYIEKCFSGKKEGETDNFPKGFTGKEEHLVRFDGKIGQFFEEENGLGLKDQEIIEESKVNGKEEEHSESKINGGGEIWNQSNGEREGTIPSYSSELTAIGSQIQSDLKGKTEESSLKGKNEMGLIKDENEIGEGSWKNSSSQEGKAQKIKGKNSPLIQGSEETLEKSQLVKRESSELGETPLEFCEESSRVIKEVATEEKIERPSKKVHGSDEDGNGKNSPRIA